ncbi:MAG: hypothetical protein IRZ21_02210 [Thermoleophilaceae bacterium]|nr:hypothetical protein [Thermoleophilaceae bacterium]
MIDLHVHALPGIDDGPADLAGAVELLRAAAEQGTTTVAATPHLREDFPLVHADELESRCRQLRAALPPELRIELVQGGEVDILWAREASDEELRLVSYGARGAYLLIETPHVALPNAFEALLAEVAGRGYRILLAHPEWNPTFQADPERLRRLVARGVLVQVTALSLTLSDRGARARRLAEALLREGAAHVIASDAHSGGRFRPPALAAGVEAARRIAPLRARWMVTDAPAAILAGEPLPQPPGERRRGLLSRLGLGAGRRDSRSTAP